MNRVQLNEQSLYIKLVSCLGIFLLLFSFSKIPAYGNIQNFILLVLLASISEIASASITTGNNKTAYEVGTTVSLAAVPFYGPSAAIIIVTFSSAAFSLVKNFRQPIKKHNWQQFFFNIGMHSVAAFLASNVFILINSENEANLLLTGLAWLTSAIVYDQANFWLLTILLQLMNGNKFSKRHFLQENVWAMIINIAVLLIGGSLLAYAVNQFDYLGIIIFFLPIILSTFSFQVYVSKMKSHLQMLEKMIDERTQQLSDLMKEKDKFLAVLTHDMQTPLTTISLYVDLLTRQNNLTEKNHRMLQIIKRSQENLTQMVHNILDLEKLGSGQGLSLNLEPVNIVDQVELVAFEMELSAQKKGIDLFFNSHNCNIIVEADRSQISRVLQNIISNAIKYTPTGGYVKIVVSHTNQQIQIDVEDNGYGIPKEDIPYIFDTYRRVKKHETVELGSGLGLAISKMIVEAHQGKLLVDSQEDVGSTFSVLIPLCSQQSDRETEQVQISL